MKFVFILQYSFATCSPDFVLVLYECKNEAKNKQLLVGHKEIYQSSPALD
jgi:hypothetical protein